MPDRSITEVFDANLRSVMALPGVVGVGIGEHGGEPCIRVMVEIATPAVRAEIPDQFGGYPVIVEETGPFTAFSAQ